MTRLVKFLILIGGIIGIWATILGSFYDPKNNIILYCILPFPIHILLIFGLFSVYTVLNRTFNFNDCPEAGEELQNQIEEAKADLKLKGFKF